MKRHALLLGLLCLAAGNAPCRDWYAAPNAGVNGDGSLSNPWALQVALQKTASIVQGDTLYLRGGTYQGPGFISTLSGTANNYITVRSYPGEWAVVSDGSSGQLLNSLPVGTGYTTATGVIISGSEFWSPGTVVGAGVEQLQLGDRGSNRTNWTVIRGWNGTPATNHAVGTQIKLRASFIEHTGSFVTFRDFEISGRGATNRTINANNYLGCGLNLLTKNAGNKALNLVIHNVGHPAIGFWQQGLGGEINGCIVYGAGIYDNDGTWTRGSAVYGQNEGGLVQIKNNISFRTFNVGMTLYGETGPVRDALFKENIFFDFPLYPTEASSGSTSTSNTWFVSNWMMGSPLLSYVSLSNTHQFFLSNVVVNGKIYVKETSRSAYTNNTVFVPANSGHGEFLNGYYSTYFAKNQLQISWDRNTYYLGTAASPYNWGFNSSDVSSQNALGGGNLKFSTDGGKAWKDWSGFDSNSTYAAAWPTNYLLVEARRLDYNTNRYHVIVISTSTQTNASLSAASLGLSLGGQYALRDAQNYGSILLTGVVSSASISLPLSLTNVAPIHGVTHFTNLHTNIRYPRLFNAFVVDKLESLAPAAPTGLRVVEP